MPPPEDDDCMTVVPGDVTVPPPVPRPEASLAAMDSEARELFPSRRVGSAPVSCPRKWTEVTLRTTAGEPVSGAKCTLEVPGGGGASANTDGSGVARFEGIGVDATKAMLEVHVKEEDDATT